MDQVNIARCQFRRAGKLYNFLADRVELKIGDKVVVETDRGPSLAEVIQVAFENKTSLPEGIKPVMRLAREKDLISQHPLTEDEITAEARNMIKELKLKMMVLKAELQLGGNKIIIYFNAPARVDFRELVKKLAGQFKSRVELKQIGSRDETKVLGGVGVCGREYCCSSFLREFMPVSIKMAKNQNLALNPSKISGGCGRLLCCLTYEDEMYTSLYKSMPREGTEIKTRDGQRGRVRVRDIFKNAVIVELEGGVREKLSIDEIEIVVRKQDTPKVKPAENKEAKKDDTWGDDLDLKDLMKDK